MRWIIFIALGIIIIACLTLFFIQERLLFYPEILSKDYQFQFDWKFKEVNIEVENGINLNNLHFKTPNSKGVVLFFHGNGGSISGWGHGADLFLTNGYDVFYVDYRGYGKSDGAIKSENQLIADGQIIYNHLKTQYPEQKIIISGTSLGTGIASQIARNNDPKLLILNAPYFSLINLIKEKVPLVPRFIVKYKMKTYKHLNAVNCPIYIFHGRNDEVIPVHHAMKLKEMLPNIELSVIEGYGHNNLSASQVYGKKMAVILK